MALQIAWGTILCKNHYSHPLSVRGLLVHAGEGLLMILSTVTVSGFASSAASSAKGRVSSFVQTL